MWRMNVLAVFYAALFAAMTWLMASAWGRSDALLWSCGMMLVLIAANTAPTPPTEDK